MPYVTAGLYHSIAGSPAHLTTLPVGGGGNPSPGQAQLPRNKLPWPHSRATTMVITTTPTSARHLERVQNLAWGRRVNDF